MFASFELLLGGMSASGMALTYESYRMLCLSLSSISGDRAMALFSAVDGHLLPLA
ncbi:MAG: hypothetical protein SXA11_21100 [Cyanobacteriota bacterium]|nr:hypothetical protein [Cyanobacteriota bacterium]